MASLTLASPCIASTVFNSEARDDSFSSYLKLIRESLAKDVISSDSGECPTTMRISIGKNQAEDGDGDIFRAEKYFSGVMDGDTTQVEAPEKSPVSSSYKKVGKMSLQSRSVTESTCSETSANSRNTLLRSHRRKLSSSSSRRAGRRFFGVFRCSCSGKDAISVEEDINGIKKSEEAEFGERASFATKIEDGLTFMTLSSQMAARMTIQKETFGSPFILRKSLTLLTPPSKEVEEEDLRSETSSDLFEIESLSINGNPLFRPEMNTYAPSEASIEWSVTTASAGNDDRRITDEPKRHSRSSKPSMLLGCANNKSVDATTENYKKPERLSSSSYEQMLRVESLIPPLMRYHTSQSRRSLDFTHGAL